MGGAKQRGRPAWIATGFSAFQHGYGTGVSRRLVDRHAHGYGIMKHGNYGSMPGTPLSAYSPNMLLRMRSLTLKRVFCSLRISGAELYAPRMLTGPLLSRLDPSAWVHVNGGCFFLPRSHHRSQFALRISLRAIVYRRRPRRGPSLADGPAPAALHAHAAPVQRAPPAQVREVSMSTSTRPKTVPLWSPTKAPPNYAYQRPEAHRHGRLLATLPQPTGLH